MGLQAGWRLRARLHTPVLRLPTLRFHAQPLPPCCLQLKLLFMLLFGARAALPASGHRHRCWWPSGGLCTKHRTTLAAGHSLALHGVPGRLARPRGAAANRARSVHADGLDARAR